nr:hypothetical protein Itr_chr07CG07620 [Ipomoea trifida]
MAVRTIPCGGMVILSLSRLSPVSGGASSNVGQWRGWRKSLDNAMFLLIDQRQRVDGDGDGRFPCFSMADDGNDETPAAGLLPGILPCTQQRPSLQTSSRGSRQQWRFLWSFSPSPDDK